MGEDANDMIKIFVAIWIDFDNFDDKYFQINDSKETMEVSMFLAVHNSSIGDLVTDSLTDSLTFTFDIQRATQETCDLSDIWS